MNRFGVRGYALAILAGFSAILPSCAMPLRVAQVEANTAKAPAGIRYWLRTPVFRPALWSDGTKSLDNIQFRLTQTFDGEPKLMEVGIRGSVTANTEVEITMDDEGALSSLISGEEDQTSEAIEAIVGLATSISGLDSPGTKERDPNPVDPRTPWEKLQALDPKLDAYVAAQAKRKSEIDLLEASLLGHRQRLASASPSDFKALVLAIDTLEATVSDLRRAWESRVFPLSPARCHILEGEKRLYATGNSPWITVDLSANAPGNQ